MVETINWERPAIHFKDATASKNSTQNPQYSWWPEFSHAFGEKDHLKPRLGKNVRPTIWGTSPS